MRDPLVDLTRKSTGEMGADELASDSPQKCRASRWAGARLDQQTFHDVILAQGLLSTDLLRKAVPEDFVGSTAK
jgi:hypothetical protein